MHPPFATRPKSRRVRMKASTPRQFVRRPALIRKRLLTACVAAQALLAVSAAASAYTVGERHFVAHEPSAALRDAAHRDDLRVTLWYPAAADAVEAPLDIGPMYESSSAAPDAAFTDQQPRPVILFSHGFGGTARIMAWFGTALARHGYVVIAVDHPGNNGADPMTVGGAVLFWERPGDLAAALSRVESETAIVTHLDERRLGVAGFSAGGFTSLAVAGGRVDIARLQAFCAAHPQDGICAPQREFKFTEQQVKALVAEPEGARELARSNGDLSIPGVRAVYVMAPALVQSFDPGSLRQLHVPVGVILGDADRVAPPATNGEVAAATIPGARIAVLPRVGHYDFLAECTSLGDKEVPICPTSVPRSQTHQAALDGALALFDNAFGTP
jgi:predicted dienelactone hydrolase